MKKTLIPLPHWAMLDWSRLITLSSARFIRLAKGASSFAPGTQLDYNSTSTIHPGCFRVSRRCCTERKDFSFRRPGRPKVLHEFSPGDQKNDIRKTGKN